MQFGYDFRFTIIATPPIPVPVASHNDLGFVRVTLL